MHDCAVVEPAGPARVAGDPPSFLIREGTSDENALAEVWTRNAYQRPRWGFAIEAGDRWLDLGANIGAFSVLAGRAAQLVGAYEPEPENYALLRENLRMNGLEEPVPVFAAVVPDDFPETHVTLNVQHAPKALYRHSIMFARRDSHRLEVAAQRISDVVARHDPTAIKMDIEGAEVPILTSWQPPSTVRKLVAEWSFDVDRRTATLGDALGILGRHFDHVRLDKKVDMAKPTFDFYPPTAMIYAWS